MLTDHPLVLNKDFYISIHIHNLDMRNVFRTLTRNNLDIQYIFSDNYWCGASGDRTHVTEVFSNNNILTLVGCFRISGDSISDSNPRSQYVKFSNIFKQNYYNTSTYSNDVNFSYAFYGYARNYPDFTEETSLNNNQTTNNYTTL